ncbi:ATP-binding protein [Agromyces aurantiacus]|uniref:histidine kinase n=1 Tax=Agromyces aurantiacus TaxID=165814 RepID=A0ABV9R5Q2_9MICO|nr:GAF domain-containing sensor histidine kinase [Agromyces aurantiacus]MBM7503630.1 signal transduction histidine kinase [Agromyces aurantiacus]
MFRRWAWFAALAPLGAVSVAYVVLARGFASDDIPRGVLWPLLGILPLVAFGLWLLTVSTSRAALYIAWTGTAIAVGAALETFANATPELESSPWFPLLSAARLTVDAVSGAAFITMFATFPTGVPERRWQRIALWFVWLPVVVAPLSVLVTPTLLLPQFHEPNAETIANPFALPALSWAAPAVEWIVHSFPSVAFGMAVLVARAFFGAPEVRARMRLMTWVVLGLVVSWSLWLFVPSPPVEAAVFVTLAAIPIAAVHGILRYGAFDIAPGARAQFVARSSTVLITALYGIAVAAPALLFVDSLTVVGAVLLTTLMAVGLLPVRGWTQRRIQRLVFGDRDRQFGMLSELGERLERSGDPRELLTHLAAAVRDGLDASWVRIRPVTTDDASAWPAGVAGVVAGDPVESVDLVHADETLGRIEVGPRRRGEYSDAERTVLRTVAGQAAASVANVRLTAQLAARLDELTASRERIVAAQDDERRRLERDLHDGIQQDVVAQIAGLRLARNRLARGDLEPGELTALQDQARATLTDLRELARGIHPPVLSDNGLVAAVESGVARFPIPLTVEADAAVRAERYPEEVETTAYYVVREALANTAKHAGATHASVEIARSDGRLRVTISDDGCGIDPSLGREASRGGLANIRDRVAALRGTVSVGADAPSGTRVLVDLPIAREGSVVG